jgi:hypothetical protein
MNNLRMIAFAALVTVGVLIVSSEPANAQVPVPVTAYYATPVAPVVTYLPERRGLFGQRLVYRPVVGYTAPAVAPVAAPIVAPVAAPAVVPAAPVTTYYAPAPVPVTTFRPVAPVVIAPAPVSVYYPPVAVPVFVP